MPDIGQIFPDTDPKWQGASSDIFVKEACKIMKEKGYSIGNIDCTLIAQKPKLSPHKEDIRWALMKLSPVGTEEIWAFAPKWVMQLGVLHWRFSVWLKLCRNNLCELLETHPNCVNLKAKTHEKVDSIGEERSIACHTVVLLIRT
jgi:2-C-methyl-D-erythritol 2,4-cyclodiphosphate synthase